MSKFIWAQSEDAEKHSALRLRSISTKRKAEEGAFTVQYTSGITKICLSVAVAWNPQHFKPYFGNLKFLLQLSSEWRNGREEGWAILLFPLYVSQTKKYTPVTSLKLITTSELCLLQTSPDSRKVSYRILVKGASDWSLKTKHRMGLLVGLARTTVVGFFFFF